MIILKVNYMMDCNEQLPKIFMDLINRVLSTQRNYTLNLYWASDLFAN